MSHMMQTTAKQQSKQQQQGKGALQLKEISIIPITAAPANTNQISIVATNANQSMADDDSADLLRKKRCTDRYDSSESSDSGVVTMSADSTATSDSSDPGSPFSNASGSTCTDDVTTQKLSSKVVSSQTTINGKALKRQAQVTEKVDKKRVRKEVPVAKKGNVEIKLIPLNATQTSQQSVTTSESVVSTIAKKANMVKSTLSAITNNINVFKSQAKSAINNQSQPSLVIPTQQQMTSVNTANGIGTTISKLTDYYKLKKDLTNNSNIEKYCNMLLNLQQQSSAKQNNQNTVKTKELTIATAKNKIAGATTITPISSQSKQTTPTLVKAISTSSQTITPKKSLANEKKTAKIAPIIPVARKNSTMTTSTQQPVKISPKKPVSIAPRIVGKTVPNNKNPTAIIHPKTAATTVSMTSNEKLNSSIAEQQQQQHQQQQQQQQQQPTVLLAAIRIPNQSQPPPLKIQNGLIQKTSTTMTTKLAPLLQFHTQPIMPNLIQLPNLIATTTPTKTKQTAQTATPLQQNLILNNTQLTQQQQQQQLFMNGAVIKLQPVSSQQQNSSQTVTSSTTVSNMTSINGTTQKFTIQQQQQAFTAQLAAQHMQQLFMTTPVLFPTVLTSQLTGLQHAFNQQQAAVSMAAPPSTIPALQPIQSSLLSSSFSSSSLTSTTNSIQLPSFSTLLHNHAGMQATPVTSAQHIQNTQLQSIPTFMKPAFTTASLPPSLTITSGFVQSSNTQPILTTQQHHHQHHHQQQQKVNVPPQATIAPSPKSNPPPPLAPASNLPINITNYPKLISVASSSCQTSPKSPPPLIIPQKVSLPHGSPVVTLPTAPVKQEMTNTNGEITKNNAICIVPPLPSPEKSSLKVETQEKITIIETSKDSIKSAITVTVEEKASIECAKSPILSQPKTIRFPPVKGKVTVWKKCVKISKTGVCNWEKCSKQFDSNADLLEHLHMNHINEQEGPFVCSWRDCKVNGREGSKGWLERHVMSHVGSKPFKCIVERCGMRFSSQVQLEKHVNGHFNSSDQPTSNKRTSDPPMPKKVKKDQKKTTKVRRQPWSARRFDFFDVGMMDVLQYRLEKSEKIMHGRDIEVTFKGRIIGKRRAINGDDEYQVTWSPLKIIDDEWMNKPADANKPNFQLVKHVSIKRMSPSQRIALEEHVNTIVKSNHKGQNGVKQLRKCSSTCSSRASVTSTST